jgi:nucleoside 2-deoxyribosyltransferase
MTAPQMNIYIACGLTHVPREIFDRYVDFLHQLAASLRTLPTVATVKYALVDSDPQLASKPKAEQAALCYDWDRRMVEDADLIVAEASFPSTGLGIELQIAETRGKPIIMLIGDHRFNRAERAHYENPDHTEHDLQIGDGIVSLMALGLPAIRRTVPYSEFDAGIVGAVEAVKLYI